MSSGTDALIGIGCTPPRRADGGRAYPDGAIAALMAFLDALAAAPVHHCLWKSNLHLTAALVGETDLDMLIRRDQAALFREIAGRHGLKSLVPAPSAAYPAMEHYLGFDAPTGRLFHLHVHHQLVVGEKYVKNYRLPLEAQFLASTRTLHGVAVPRAELDLSMLAVRCLLKYRARDVIKDVLKIRSPGIPDEIRAEIAWLMRDTTDDSRSATAMMNADIVPADVIQQFVQTVAANPRDGFALLRLRTRLRRGLRDGQRRSRFSASVEYFWNVWRRRKRLRLRRFETRMTPAGGGLTVGFVGADGSGKSTITAATADWLRWKLDARVHYLGSKEPSRASRLLYVAFRALRRGHRSVLERTGSRSVAARPSAAVRDVLLAAHHLSISRDKAIRYRQARRETQGGSIAIFDRFPMEELSRHPAHRRLDGPQISAALGESMGRFTRRLASTEEQLYRTFGLPDCLFVLEVDPEIASRRKPDHDPQLIAAKARAAAELAELAELRGCAVIRLDANRPLESVLLDVKARLWDAL